MCNDEPKQSPEQPTTEEQEETIEIREAELSPTPQDIEMPPVKPPKKESDS